MRANPRVDESVRAAQLCAGLARIGDERRDEDLRTPAMNIRDDGAAVAVAQEDGCALAAVDHRLDRGDVLGEGAAMQARGVDDRSLAPQHAGELLHVGGLMEEAMHQDDVGRVHELQ